MSAPVAACAAFATHNNKTGVGLQTIASKILIGTGTVVLVGFPSQIWVSEANAPTYNSISILKIVSDGWVRKNFSIILR